jgi:type II secretory pathway component PulL
VAVLAALSAVCAVAGLQTPVMGRILLWLAGAAIAVVAVRDAVVRPTLATDDAGVTVVRTWRPQRLTWGEIEAIAPYVHRRLAALEIDAGEVLVVVPARRLGADLSEVVDALRTERLRHRT